MSDAIQHNSIEYISDPPKFTNHFQMSAIPDGVLFEFRSLTPIITGGAGGGAVALDLTKIHPHTRIIMSHEAAFKFKSLVERIIVDDSSPQNPDEEAQQPDG